MRRSCCDVRGIDSAGGVPVHDVSFAVHAGEIVGLAGLVGAGRTEIVRAIAGADVPSRGDVRVDGAARRRALAAHDAIRAGIALDHRGPQSARARARHDRAREHDARAPGDFVRRGFVDSAAETRRRAREIAELRIRTPSSEQIVRNLSGGNQQKVVLAKWLIGHARVFLFDEPTRGIDVGAKAEIYALMVELLRRGAAIVMVSSELPEVLGMSHRVLVVRGGAHPRRVRARRRDARQGDRRRDGSRAR